MKIFVRNKRGSLSLSMEAIVILILAVVMLGLGLTFVRTMFQNITDKASTAIDVADLAAKPDSGNIVVFSPANPDVKEKSSKTVQVGFYNPSTTNSKWLMKVLDDRGDLMTAAQPGSTFGSPCGGLNGTPQCYDKIDTFYTNKSFTLEKDKSIGWNLILAPTQGTVSSSMPSMPFLLTVVFCSIDTGAQVQTNDCTTTSEMYQKDVVITVRK